MKPPKKILFIVLVLVSSIAIAGPLELGSTIDSIREPAKMLLIGIGLVVLAVYGRKKLSKR
jgi:hypothetical protein